MATYDDDPILGLIDFTIDTVKQLPGIDNVVDIYSDENLRELIAMGATALTIGVLYEGSKGTNTSGSGRSGLSAEAVISLFIAYPTTIAGIKVPPREGLKILSKLRNHLRTLRPGDKHMLRFMAEVPAIEKDGAIIWMQRWAVPVILTQNME